MSVGLQNSLATFQRVMDKTLRPHQAYVAVYLDYVIIHCDDWDLHLPKVQTVFDSIWKTGFTANTTKMYHWTRRDQVSEVYHWERYNKAPGKQSWGYSKLVTPHQQEAGLSTFRNHWLLLAFIPHFASQVAPLTNLTKGKEPVMNKWTSKAEAAFGALKQALCSQPTLYSPDFSRYFVVQSDASDVGWEAVLFQVFRGEEHPVNNLSRKLKPHEVNYTTIKTECLAIK